MLIKQGIVTKKKSIIKSKRYKLILTNQPRLYMTQENGEYKTDILLTPFVRAVSRQSNKFEIICSKSGMNLQFTVNGEDSGIWVTKINRVIDIHTK